MNGEHFWSKEFGVAMVRHFKTRQKDISVVHPADCYGDLGCATSPVLLGLAAMDLWSEFKLCKEEPGTNHLIYCSSDYGARAVLQIQKIDLNLIST